MSGTTGQQGSALVVHGVGAWVVYGVCMGGVVVDICVLPGLVRLDLKGLDLLVDHMVGHSTLTPTLVG